MKFNRKPSPALIVSVVALVAAGSGSAVAAGVVVDSSADIKNNVVASSDVRNGTLRERDLHRAVRSKLNRAPERGPQGPAGPPGAQGLPGPKGDPGAPAPAAKWALVAADGSILAQSGGITVEHPFTGGYYVNVGSSAKEKAITATIKWTTGATAGLVGATPCGNDGAGSVECIQPGTNTSNHVYVETRDADGATANRAFYLTVQQ